MIAALFFYFSFISVILYRIGLAPESRSCLAACYRRPHNTRWSCLLLQPLQECSTPLHLYDRQVWLHGVLGHEAQSRKVGSYTQLQAGMCMKLLIGSFLLGEAPTLMTLCPLSFLMILPSFLWKPRR